MHEAFAGASLRVAVVEIPAGGFERGFYRIGRVFMSRVGALLGAMARISVFGRKIIFLVTHDEEVNVIW